MEKLKVINGGLSPEKSEQRKKLLDEFKRDFHTALKERGVLNDFSLEGSRESKSW